MIKYEEIDINKILEPIKEIRSAMDADKLEDLSLSIKAHGILQPLLVRKAGDNYEVICGHRRFVASIKAGIHKIPCLITDGTKEEALTEKYHENAYREDLSAHEEALMFQYMTDKKEMTISQISTDTGRTQHYVQKRLDLLAFFPELIKAVREKEITLGIATELNNVTEEVPRLTYLDQAIRQNASLKKVRVWVGKWLEYNDPDLWESRREQYDAAMNPNPLTSCSLCQLEQRLKDMTQLNLCKMCMQLLFQKVEKMQEETPEPTEEKTEEEKNNYDPTKLE